MAEPRGAGPAALAQRLAGLSAEQRRRLDAALRQRGGVGLALGPPPRPPGPPPASFLQERLFLTEQLVPGTSAYVVPLAVRLRGALDVEQLRRGVQALVDRHEVLRTGLALANGRVVQAIQPAGTLPWRWYDRTETPDRRAEVDRLLRAEAGTGFDLSRPPLGRAVLIRTAPRDHVFGLFLHHAVTDGWSNGLLMGELSRIYAAGCAGREPELPAPVQYADAAYAQRSELSQARLDTLLRYWRDQLRGAPLVVDLPTDRPRGSVHNAPAGQRRFLLPVAIADGVRDLAGRLRSSPFGVLLAGWAAVLSRWSGANDLLVGSPYAGRVHAWQESVVGPFVNTVVIRVDLSGDPTFQTLAERATRAAADAVAHADLPFERLVEELAPPRSTAHNPVVQVNFGLGNVPQTPLSLPGTTAEPVAVGGGGAKYDLSLYVTQSPDRWGVNIEYSTGLFDEVSADRLAEAFVVLLGAGCAEPRRPVADLPAGELRPPGAAVTGRGAAAGPPAATAPAGAALAAGGRPPTTRFVPARDWWEWQVAQVWADVLDRPAVGATDDFFELGGNSMAGMVSTERLFQATGRRVPLAALFEHPTVESLAAHLRTASDVPHFVVPLRPGGSRPPLVLAHAAVGELSMYFNLVRALRPGRGVYGLQADGFVQEPVQPSLEQMAARYAEQIVRVVPAHRYHLAGFSAAGRLAVAVAEQLRLGGARLGTVAVLDTAPYGDVAADPDFATILSRWLPFAPPAQELVGLSRQEQVVEVLRLGVRAGDLPPDLDAAQFDRVCRRLELTARALARYRPAYRGTVTLLRQAARTDRDLAAEWRGTPIGGLRAIEVETGSHLGFTTGPGVRAVAGVLDEEFTAAEGATG